MHRSNGTTTLIPEVLLMGYKNGFFPMADSASGKMQWHRPDPRAIIPLDAVRIPRSLRQVLRKQLFSVTTNTAFARVVQLCANREDTWINDDIVDAYTALHHLGYAHSIESWQNGVLVGGLYGVSINGAFFGESMFSLQSNASKVAFAFLVNRLLALRFTLLDTQYINEFTESLGAIEVPDVIYQQLLGKALSQDTCFE